ncbi:hypothetical protein C8Q74DRAFT_849314 [Fomes fomentarius]|nr:hypothetical protein C8Q74DRAFT_849314 [Fomes fomentarius]
MAGKTYKQLTQQDADFFLAHGYIVVKEAFSKAQADAFTRDLWVRLGLDPHDPSTWDRERIHMPYHTRVPVAEFAPKAWNAITDLLGGEDRIDASSSAWGDSFIVNLGPPPSTASVFAPSFTAPAPAPPTSPEAPAGPAPETSSHYPDPRELANWHVDGDFFTHFLDSPEQALLVVPLFSPVLPHGGATFIAPDGIPILARYLAAHPEGVLPKSLSFLSSLSPFASSPTPADIPIPIPLNSEPSFYSHIATARDRCTHFVELTGSIGDVVLMHPLMLHSASPNALPHRPPRIITNPPVALKQPFRFARTNAPGDEYSLVELTTLRALGVDPEKGAKGGYEFAITQPRKTVVPARVALQAQMLEEEKRRLDAHRAKLAQPAMPNEPVVGTEAGIGAARPIAVA